MTYEMLLLNFKAQAVGTIETAKDMADEYLKVSTEQNLQLAKLAMSNAIQAIQLYQDKKAKFAQENNKEAANGKA